MDATSRTWTARGHRLTQDIDTNLSQHGRPMTVELAAKVIEQAP